MTMAGTQSDAVLAGMARLRRALWVFDIDRSRVHWANDAGLAVWRSPSLAELIARDMGADMSPAVANRLRQYQHDFERDPDASFTEVWTLYPGGQPYPVHVVFSGFRLPDDRMAMLCEALHDHADDPANLRSAEALLHTSVMITLYSTEGEALYRNPSARAATPDAELGLSERFVDPLDAARLRDTVAAVGEARVVARVRTRQGERWHEVTASRCRDAVTGGIATLVSEVDVDELKATEARARYLSQHDTLTGLPNRTYVTQGFHERLERVRLDGFQAALIFIDLDHFKHINDSLGHAVGDELLVHVAGRLRSVLRKDDLVARLGGDEFLILAAAPQISEYIAALTERILATVSKVAPVGNTTMRVTTSIGVSLYPQDGTDLDTLMRHADLAMYLAKSSGRNQVAWFTPQLTATAQSRLTLANELAVALEQGQFEVYYQPRLNTTTHQIVAAEALVRWFHPERGLVYPGEFIAVAEDCGLISALGTFVLRRAVQAQRQLAARVPGMRVSVNLSPRQITDPHLLDTVREILAETGGDATGLELEITESVLLGHVARSIQVLEALVGMGFKLALDDFGTGYSNLAYLHRYPVHCLKIDRSFIHSLDTRPALCELILTMCRMLGVATVAEGVETPDQLAWLHHNGCLEYQGFLYSSAVPLDALLGMLPEQQSQKP